MTNTIMPTVFNNGVKRLRVVGTLGAWSSIRALGDINDTIAGMESEGYNSSDLATLVAFGASDAQLQYIWDNYAPDTQEYADAFQSLVMQLTSSSMSAPSIPMTTSTAGSIYGTFNSVLTTALGAFDLSTKAGWDAIASLLVTIQQSVNAAAAQNPNDPTVISQVSQFNTEVMAFASYYEQAVGTTPATIPLASVTLHGIGDPNVSQWLGPLLGPVGDIINVLYSIWTWAKNYVATNQKVSVNNSTAALNNSQSIATLTSSYQSVLSQYQAALAAGNTTLANSLASQLQQLGTSIQKLGGVVPTSAVSTVSFTSWLSSNASWLMLGLAVLIIVPPLVKKL